MNDNILIDEYYDEECTILKTKHKHVYFYTIMDRFMVELQDGGWCEVYGKHEWDNAVTIADTFNEPAE